MKKYRGSFFWGICVTLLLIIPSPFGVSLSVPSWSDLVIHGIIYAVFAALVLKEGSQAGARYPWLLVFFVILHGIGMELVQLGIPYRSGSLADGFADCAGAAAGFMIIRFLPQGRP